MQNQKTKWMLEIDEDQARLIKNLTEFFARITAGQVEEICHELLIHAPNKENSSILLPKDYDHITDSIKQTFFPELGRNASYGAYSEELNENSRIAWDLYQVIRKPLHDKFNPYNKISVHGDEAIKTSKTCELATCKEIKN